MDTMKTYIELQQKKLSSILNNNKSKEFVNDSEIEFSKFKTWKIIATGSSANAITTAKYYIQNILNIEIEIIEPFNFVHYNTPIDKDALYISISQSGRSTSTVDATKYIMSKTNKIIVVSSDLKSPICKLTNNIVDIGCGKEKVGFVTIGFTSTVLTLELLALNISLKIKKINEEEFNREISEFSSIINEIDNIIKKSNIWYENNRNQFLEAEKILTIGYGSGYGISCEAETKITETVRCSMNGYELEEYMHGPYLSLNKDTYIIGLQTKNKLENRLDLLMNYISQYTKHKYKITYHSSANDNKELALNTSINELKSSILFVIPIQILSYRLAEDKGIDLSLRIFDDFDKVLKSKI